MSSNEYVKYITEKVLNYVFSTKEEKIESKKRRKSQREPFLFRWFGVLPIAILIQVKKRKG